MKALLSLTLFLCATSALAKNAVFTRTIVSEDSVYGENSAESCSVYKDRVDVTKTATVLRATTSKSRPNAFADYSKVEEMILAAEKGAIVELDLGEMITAKNYKAQYKEDGESVTLLSIGAKGAPTLKNDAPITKTLIQQIDLLCNF